MIDPSTFSPPIKKGDPPLSPSQVLRKLTRAANRVVAPLHQNQILFMDSPLKTPIGQAGAAVQNASLEINVFNHQLHAYRKAVARLDHHLKSEGRPEVTEMVETGELDENGDPIMEEQLLISAIESVPATVARDVYNEETGETTTVQVENPIITKDEAERAHAMAVITNTPQAVKDFDNG